MQQLNCFDQPQDADITPLDFSDNETCKTYAPGSYHDAGIGRYLVQCTTNVLPNSLCLATSSPPVATCPFGYILNGSQCVPLATGPSATLKAAPLLVRSGDSTTIYWTSQNVDSCTVHGSNGDFWSATSSAGKISSPIIGQTIYTLHCNIFSGAMPSSIDKSAIVNIVPQFIEK